MRAGTAGTPPPGRHEFLQLRVHAAQSVLGALDPEHDPDLGDQFDPVDRLGEEVVGARGATIAVLK